MRKFLFCLSFLYTFSFFSQNKEDNKLFINKNYHAIILIQKQIVSKQIFDSHDQFKDLIMLQAEAVKLYSKKSSDAMKMAVYVRLKSLEFFEQNSPNSIEFFKSNISINAFTSEELKARKIALSSNEQEQIKSLNISDLNSLKNISLSIQ